MAGAGAEQALGNLQNNLQDLNNKAASLPGIVDWCSKKYIAEPHNRAETFQATQQYATDAFKIIEELVDKVAGDVVGILKAQADDLDHMAAHVQSLSERIKNTHKCAGQKGLKTVLVPNPPDSRGELFERLSGDAIAPAAQPLPPFVHQSINLAELDMNEVVTSVHRLPTRAKSNSVSRASLSRGLSERDAHMSLSDFPASGLSAPPSLSQASGPPPALSHASGPPPVLSQASGPPPALSQASGPPPALSQASGPPPALSQASGPPPALSQASGPPPALSQASGPPPALSQASGPPPALSQAPAPPPPLSGPPSIAPPPAAPPPPMSQPAQGGRPLRLMVPGQQDMHCDGVVCRNGPSDAYRTALGVDDLPPNTGKHFFEIEVGQSAASMVFFGFWDASDLEVLDYFANNNSFTVCLASGEVFRNAQQSELLARQFVQGDRVGLLYDSDAGTMQAFVNGEPHPDLAFTDASGTLRAVVTFYNANDEVVVTEQSYVSA